MPLRYCLLLGQNLLKENTSRSAKFTHRTEKYQIYWASGPLILPFPKAIDDSALGWTDDYEFDEKEKVMKKTGRRKYGGTNQPWETVFGGYNKFKACHPLIELVTYEMDPQPEDPPKLMPKFNIGPLPAGTWVLHWVMGLGMCSLSVSNRVFPLCGICLGKLVLPREAKRFLRQAPHHTSSALSQRRPHLGACIQWLNVLTGREGKSPQQNAREETISRSTQDCTRAKALEQCCWIECGYYVYHQASKRCFFSLRGVV